MRSSRLSFSLLLLLLTFFAVNLTTLATEDEPDDYDVKARVVRISLISGEVTLKRKGNSEWERARLNFPLVEGDTVATDRESRLEIQIDARNFVRLAPNTTVQFVSLREEGVALSVSEGTATVRLAKFDKQREYFEIDAPKTTLAAEKKGLYRIDVPQGGRVRFTVRDGGTARIYSDTSGFALRDGRTAELVIDGSNAGDWEFVAAANDGYDDWVKDRERYLAQRLRYNVQYYDEYVWGAEDLDAYGDWNYTSDYGWVWRPHATVINVYNDWAPYRYGHWVWFPPYGWTWVGYEPWGWAPYHYGRWVYHNNYWAWCPRSSFYRDYSWWRPALVAFYYVDNNYCWYPLGYHQRDPRSSYYDKPGRLTALRADELANLRRVNPATLRAVTSASAQQIGTENQRPQRASEALARRAIGSEMLRTGLPARAPARENTAGGTGEVTVGRPARASTSAQPVERPTGAATRTPGVPLDNDLRRTRVLNGRDARPATPTVNTTTGAEVESRPTGAVTRPPRTSDTVDRSSDEQRPERRPASSPGNSSGDAPVARPPRIEPSVDSDSGERPSRSRERSEPTARPERRSDSPTPTYQPPPQRNDPPPRVEAPQRSEPAPQRSQPAPQRSEPPPQRSEPPARPSRPDNDSQPSRSESRPEPSRSESPRSEPSRSEPSRSEPSRSEPSRSEPSRAEPTRSEPTRSEPARDPDSGRPSAKPDRPRR